MYHDDNLFSNGMNAVLCLTVVLDHRTEGKGCNIKGALGRVFPTPSALLEGFVCSLGDHLAEWGVRASTWNTKIKLKLSVKPVCWGLLIWKQLVDAD